jgi:hypothetical protein
MSTETITPAVDQAASPAPATAGNSYSVVGLVLSILSIPLGMGPLAIAGVILGFVGRSKEPAAVTTANWAIVVGFLSLFGWILLGLGAAFVALPWAVGAWSFAAFLG